MSINSHYPGFATVKCNCRYSGYLLNDPFSKRPFPLIYILCPGCGKKIYVANCSDCNFSYCVQEKELTGESNSLVCAHCGTLNDIDPLRALPSDLKIIPYKDIPREIKREMFAKFPWWPLIAGVVIQIGYNLLRNYNVVSTFYIGMLAIHSLPLYAGFTLSLLLYWKNKRDIR